MTSVKLFNVSSRGGSASLWFTKVLNENGAFALHAFRRDPFRNLPSDLGKPEEPSTMFGALEDMWLHSYSDRPVGIVHTYFGATGVRDSVIDRGGRFAAMFRNPLHRVVSLFTHHCVLDLAFSVPDDGRFFDAITRHLASVSEEEAERFGTLFRSILHEVIESDRDSLVRSEQNERIMFESLFDRSGHLERSVARLLGKRPEDIVASSAKGRINRHTVQRAECFSELPSVLRRMANIVIDRSDLCVSDWVGIYRELGYDGKRIFAGLG